MEPVVAIVVALVLVVLSFLFGRSSGRSSAVLEGRGEGQSEGRKEAEARMRGVAQSVARGQLPEGGDQGSAEAELYAALRSGWAPRETERRAALIEAIGRVTAFLASTVRAPLADAESADADELRERMARALGALEDLDFYLEEPPDEREHTDLTPLIQRLAREFANDHEVGLRLALSGVPVRAAVNAQVFMDGLYLILHNAARFGGGGTVDVSVESVDGRATINVRDRGEGFSEEDFQRAFDPFYSSSPEGLGLGLPHARTLIEGMGGRIELSNVPGGGAQVEVSFAAE